MENKRILMDSISIELIRYETMKFFDEKSKDFLEQNFIEALSEIPIVPPADNNKLFFSKR